MTRMPQPLGKCAHHHYHHSTAGHVDSCITSGMPGSVSIARGHPEEASLALSEPKGEGTWVSSRPSAAAHLFLWRDEPRERAWQVPLPQNSPATRLDSPTWHGPPSAHAFIHSSCMHACIHSFHPAEKQRPRRGSAFVARWPSDSPGSCRERGSVLGQWGAPDATRCQALPGSRSRSKQMPVGRGSGPTLSQPGRTTEAPVPSTSSSLPPG